MVGDPVVFATVDGMLAYDADGNQVYHNTSNFLDRDIGVDNDRHAYSGRFFSSYGFDESGTIKWSKQTDTYSEPVQWEAASVGYDGRIAIIEGNRIVKAFTNDGSESEATSNAIDELTFSIKSQNNGESYIQTADTIYKFDEENDSIAWQKSASNPTDLAYYQREWGVGRVDPFLVYADDSGTHRLDVDTGDNIWTATEFSAGDDRTVDTVDVIYGHGVVSGVDGDVYRYDKDGNTVTSLSLTGVSSVNVAMSGYGNVYLMYYDDSDTPKLRKTDNQLNEEWTVTLSDGGGRVKAYRYQPPEQPTSLNLSLG